MELKEKLTDLRKKKRLTQLELAEELQVSRQAVSRWEVGTAVPSTNNLQYLCGLYGVPLEYLLNESAQLSSNGGEELSANSPAEDSKAKERDWKKTAGIVFLALAVLAVLLFSITAARKQEEPVSSMEDMLRGEVEITGKFGLDW